MMLINLIVYSCLAVAFLHTVSNAIDYRAHKTEWVPWACSAAAILLHPLIVAIASSSQAIIVSYSKSPLSDSMSREDYTSIMAAFAVIAIAALSRVAGKLVWWTSPIIVLLMLNAAIFEAMTPSDGRKVSLSYILPFVFVAVVLYIVRPKEYVHREIVGETDTPMGVAEKRH